jgi:glycerate kinase
MRIVVAPDKFEGSLTASQAAQAIMAGLRRTHPHAEVICLPIGDGGAGTLDALLGAGFEPIRTAVTGPTGRPVEATIALRDEYCFVEMAEASGLKRLPGGRPAPLEATTFGTGELIRAALDLGVYQFALGIGGSATTDGGAGMASALGVRFLDAEGRELPRGGISLSQLAHIDMSGLDPRLAGVKVTVACDVDNPLVGPHGAAAIYGPQKGATPEDVRRLDSALRHYAHVLVNEIGIEVAATPGAGAAGGLGAGAIAFLHADMVSGIELILDLLEFNRHVKGADLVITGEGKLDAQSLRGKAPWGVARASGSHGVPVIALAGVVKLGRRDLRLAGFKEAHALTGLEPSVSRCMTEAAPLLERLAERVSGAWTNNSY